MNPVRAQWRKATRKQRDWVIFHFEAIPPARRWGQVRRGLLEIVDGLVLVLSCGRYASTFALDMTGKMVDRRLAELGIK